MGKKKYISIKYVEKQLARRKYTGNKQQRNTLAKQVIKHFKENNVKVNQKNILKYIAATRVKVKKGTPPTLVEGLANRIEYFGLVDYPKHLLTQPISDNIVLTAPDIFPKDKEKDKVKVGTLISYEDYFGAFVRYCNGVIDELKEGLGQDDYGIYVQPLPLYIQKTGQFKGYWVLKLIVTDKDGTEIKIGYKGEVEGKAKSEGKGKDKDKGLDLGKDKGLDLGKDKGLDLGKDKGLDLDLEIKRLQAEAELAKQQAAKAKAEAIKEAMNLLKSKTIDQDTFKLIISNL